MYRQSLQQWIAASLLTAVMVIGLFTGRAAGQSYAASGGIASIRTFSPGLIAGTLDRGSFGAFALPYTHHIGLRGYTCGNSFGPYYASPFYYGPGLDHFALADDPTRRHELRREYYKLVINQFLQAARQGQEELFFLEKLQHEADVNSQLAHDIRGIIHEFGRVATTRGAEAQAADYGGDAVPVGAGSLADILQRKCYQCHRGGSSKGGYDLTQIHHYAPEQWEAVIRVSRTGEMPPQSARDPHPLTDEELDVLFSARRLALSGEAGEAGEE